MQSEPRTHACCCLLERTGPRYGRSAAADHKSPGSRRRRYAAPSYSSRHTPTPVSSRWAPQYSDEEEEVSSYRRRREERHRRSERHDKGWSVNS